MKNSLKRFWNGKFFGLLISTLILVKVFLLTVYEKMISKLWCYNLKERTSNIKVQLGTSIRNPGNISLNKGVSIGRYCQLSSEFTDSHLSIGANTHIDKRCTLDFTGNLIIGDNVTISEGVMIETHSHGINPRSEAKKMELSIGDRAWLGARAVILPSVDFIGEGAVIGAGSIVTKSVNPYEIVAGNPAKVIKKL